MATTEQFEEFDAQVTPEEAEMAKAAKECIIEALDHSRANSIKLYCENPADGPSLSLPPKALRLIAQLLGLMSERKAFALIHKDQELSTVEAANYLNVSRPFVIKELKEGRLRFRLVGSHRRISFADLREYGKEMRRGQKAALQRMADDATELGLKY